MENILISLCIDFLHSNNLSKYSKETIDPRICILCGLRSHKTKKSSGEDEIHKMKLNHAF